MNIKKKAVSLLAALAVLCTAEAACCKNVSARDMELYVDNHRLVRNVQSIEGFDMLPVMDIAGELGFGCAFNGTTATLYRGGEIYRFTLDSPTVYNQDGQGYGLDVVPQLIDGKLYIPAKFFQDVFRKTYVWDPVTDALFLGSENAYDWLVSTPEYREAKRIKEERKPFCGMWYSRFDDELLEDYHSCYAEVKPDGSFYFRTWRTLVCGTYTVTEKNRFTVNGALYFNPAGTDQYYCDSPVTEEYELSGGTLRNVSDGTAYVKTGGNTDDTAVFSADGRACLIAKSEAAAWRKVGWYTEPVSYVYAPDGRCEIIPSSEVAAWEAVGWSRNPYFL